MVFQIWNWSELSEICLKVGSLWYRGTLYCLNAAGFQPCLEPLILLFISSVGIFIMYMKQPHTALTCVNSPIRNQSSIDSRR